MVAPFGVLLPDELVVAARINSIGKNHIHRDSYIYEPVRRRSALPPTADVRAPLRTVFPG